jgi:hypothetical protein
MLNNTDERYAGFPLGGILRAAKKNFAPRAKFRLVGEEDVIRCKRFVVISSNVQPGGKYVL